MALSREEVARRILALPPHRQAAAAAAALKVFGPAPVTAVPPPDFGRYSHDAVGYIRDKLRWEPWAGQDGEPGQLEVIRAYEHALAQQIERREYEHGRLAEGELKFWAPGETIRNRLRLEAGHTVGKTKLASGLFSHFFDCFPPAIVYTFAPSWKQIKHLLWKEIETDRKGRDDLPGRVLETCEIKYRPDHFATGAATSDAGGRGTERIHGQHGPYLMFILDEAEGCADFVYDAVDSMASGGIVIVLMLANPRTRTSRFHKAKTRSDTRSFRISCIAHPNVRAGREVIPGAVRRDYVVGMVERHCEPVVGHEPDNHTFDLPFPVTISSGSYPAGTIFRPDAEFMFRVLGVAPTNVADDAFVPVGRYEAAKKRDLAPAGATARMGCDVARYGKDFGTLYVRQGMAVWRAAQLAQQDTNAYAGAIITAAESLARTGVSSLHVRIDAGGGFGGGVADRIKDDQRLRALFADFQVFEVDFGGNAHLRSVDSYADHITEMYAEAAESLNGIAVLRPPDALEQDLTERRFRWVNLAGVALRRLEPKDEFRKPTRVGRSPDDGDGFVLAVAPDHLFDLPAPAGIPVGIGLTTNWSLG